MSQLCAACASFADDLVSGIPGALGTAAGRQLEARTQAFADQQWRSLDSRFPRRSILEWGEAEIEKFPTGATGLSARQQKELEGLIQPSIDGGSGRWTAGLAGLVAAGFFTGAIQVEASFRNQIPSRVPGRATPAQRLPGLSRQRPPTKILRLARRHSATSVVGIDDTSLLRLTNTIESAMLRGRTSGVKEVARAINEAFPDFSRARSELIATTEMNFAMSRGAFNRAAAMGSRLKQWITVGDDRVSQLICQPNEAGSGRGIPIDASFDSGHVTTPGHPRCRCSVAFFGASRSQIEAGLTPEGRREWVAGLNEGALQVGRFRIIRPSAPGQPGRSVIIDEAEIVRGAGIISEVGQN